MEEPKESVALDAGLISAAQAAEHYEIDRQATEGGDGAAFGRAEDALGAVGEIHRHRVAVASLDELGVRRPAIFPHVHDCHHRLPSSAIGSNTGIGDFLFVDGSTVPPTRHRPGKPA